MILGSVTSLVRTWPSTIFWRAIEKPDIGETLKAGRPIAAGRRNRGIIDPTPLKTQHSDRLAQPISRAPLRGAQPFAEIPDLFDGHHEPPDQPRDLVQLSGIVHLDGLRQTRQAFVVAQCGDIGGNDRGHRPDEFGLRGVLHRIASVKTRRHPTFAANKSIWRPHCAQASDRLAARLFRWNRRCGVNRQWQTAAYIGFPPPAEGRRRAPNWSYASARAFVIRCPLANIRFAYSSVAQR